MISMFGDFLKANNLKKVRMIFKYQNGKREILINQIEKYVDYLLDRLNKPNLHETRVQDDYMQGIGSIVRYIHQWIGSDFSLDIYNAFILYHLQQFGAVALSIHGSGNKHFVVLGEVLFKCTLLLDEMSKVYLQSDVKDVFGRFWMSIRKSQLVAVEAIRQEGLERIQPESAEVPYQFLEEK